MNFRDIACGIASRFVPSPRVESYTLGRDWLLEVAEVISEEIESALMAARLEALEEAAQALDAVPAVSQNVQLALHMARHAIRILKYRDSEIEKESK